MIVDSPGQFASKRYDYVIVGGGTAGLVLAARLTENPSVSVGVIEAGQNRLADPNLLVPGCEIKVVTSEKTFLTFPVDFNAINKPDYDWMFKSTPQKSLNDRTISLNRGKVLGGSSAINGLMCTYSSKNDIDNWEKLGNPGWGHDDLAPYYKKLASFTEPSKDIADFYHTVEVIDENLHNASGPVKTSFPNNKRFAGDAWVKTFDKLGLKMTVDPQSGKGNGGYSNLITVDAASGTRSYSATAYYQPNAKRSNLTILVQAQATKITLDHHRGGRVYATGVDFSSAGSDYHVEAEHEVLLCCGSFQSPQVLELSGIGSKKVLEPLGIDVIIENPNVGENLQDHGSVPLCFAAIEGADTFDNFQIPGVMAAETAKFFGNQDGLLTALINGNANLSYQQVDQRTGHVSTESISKSTEAAIIDAPPVLKKQYKLLRESLLNPRDSAYQFIYLPIGTQLGQSGAEGTLLPGNFITMDISISRPYSRGQVHIASKIPTDPPLIDHNYLSHPLDLELFSNGVLFMQYLATQEPLASMLKNGGKAFHPGYKHLTKETAGEFCRTALTSEYHPLGSCSMLPRKDGGVVDTKLKVYGVENLRVVDASIFPLEIRNNLQTAVYAVAEKAADIIKGDWKETESANVKNGHKRAGSHESSPKRNGKRTKTT